MSSVEDPSGADLVEVARSFGIDLDRDRSEALATAMADTLDAYRFVDAHTEVAPAVTYPRRSAVSPPADRNVLNAWAVQGLIAGSDTGPLLGRSVVVKDSIAVAEWPMRNGADVMGDYVPSVDATVVTRLLDAGAIITGKSECEYLCASGGSHTSVNGPVRNPHDPSRTAGGSSSGSAALVATGDVDLAIGGDQGGSIPVPSSYSGTVGMKPTYGLVPYTGAASIEATVDHLGPITRTVADNALLLQVLAGFDSLDPRQSPRSPVGYVQAPDQGVDGLRIGLVAEGFGTDDAQDDVDETVGSITQALRTRGAMINDVSVPMHATSMNIFVPIVLGGFLHDVVNGDGCGTGRRGLQLAEWADAHFGLRTKVSGFPPSLLMLTLAAQYVRSRHGGRHYGQAQNLGRLLTAAYDVALTDHDALVMPTTPSTAPPIPDDNAGDVAHIDAALRPLTNTAAFNVTGHPALSVPVGFRDGLPIGLMIIGRHFDEQTLYRIAGAIECLACFPIPCGV